MLSLGPNSTRNQGFINSEQFLTISQKHAYLTIEVLRSGDLCLCGISNCSQFYRDAGGSLSELNSKRSRIR